MAKVQQTKNGSQRPKTRKETPRIRAKELEWMAAGGLTREFDVAAAIKSLSESANFEMAKQIWFGLSRKDPNEKQRKEVVNGLLETGNGALPQRVVVQIAEHIDASATANAIAGIFVDKEGKLNGTATELAGMLGRRTRILVSKELKEYAQLTEGYQQSQLSTAATIFGTVQD
ncbi:MAG: hypothetical protein ABII22_03805 [Candidatus Micrarchaeota archaeon]